jgi:Astacin (Peptidase family M12A)
MGFANGTRWAYGIVPYVIDSGFSPQAVKDIERALDEWRLKTCLTFVPRTTQANFLKFQFVPGPGAPTQGCVSSALGVQGGEQQISCGDPVYAGWLGVTHEIGHAIGLAHEHQRPDRDMYITMAPTTDGNLVIDHSSTPIGGYDCVSMMHYDKNCDKISAKPGGCATWGSTTGLSAGDVATVREWYGIGIVGKATAGAVSEVSAVTLTNTNRLVTPVRDGAGNLKVIVWDVDDASAVKRRGDASEAAVSLVAACALTDHRLVTGVRDAGGNLKVIVWDVDGSGGVTRKGDASAGAISKIAMETLSQNRFATAVRDGGGNFKVIVWDVNSNGNVTRKGDASAGAVGLLAVTDLFKGGAPHAGDNRLFSAVRDGGGNLKVIIWDVDKNGKVTRTGDASAGGVSAIAVATYGPTAAMTFVSTSSGQLKLILWYVQDPGGGLVKIVRGVDRTAFAVNEVAALSPYVSVARDEDGQLTSSLWQVTAGAGAGSGIINLQAGCQGVDATKIAVTRLNDAPSPQPTSLALVRWATASRDGQGNLNILVWRHNVSLIH